MNAKQIIFTGACVALLACALGFAIRQRNRRLAQEAPVSLTGQVWVSADKLAVDTNEVKPSHLEQQQPKR